MNKYLDDDETDSDVDDDIDIHEIVRTGTFDDVKEAIAINRPRLIALKDEMSRIALHYAADLNKIKVTVFLIAKHANVNAQDDNDQTALHLASTKGLSEMVRTLLEFGADIKLRDKNCCTALHHAVEHNYIETATILVKRGVDINAEDYRYGRTALHIAAEKGYTEMVTMLLVRGADMYASGDQFYSRTPLHLACIEGHTDVVRVLVRRGADVSKLSGFLDKNPLHLACEHGHRKCVEILLAKNMDLDLCGNHINGSTALHICAELNQLAILQMLVEKGANIEKLGRFSTMGTPLHVACTHGNAHAANLLVQLGADINSRDETAHTPLHFACKSGNFDCAFMLIDLEADQTARADNNKLAFDYVTVPTIKEKILSVAAEVNRRIEARLAAERAAAEAEAARIRLEEERLERLRKEEEERIRLAVLRTAAYTKAMRSVADISGELSALLGVAEEYPDQDVNINIIHPTSEYFSDNFQHAEDIDYDMDSLTGTVHSHTTVGTNYVVYHLVNSLSNSSALTRAALRGFTDVVHALLEWPGINLNYQESNGNTALHNAALIGNREIVEMLLLAGAKLTIFNQEGKVPANVAKTAYLRELIRNPLLMKDRMKYQEKVMDHIFLRLKCKKGMSLTLHEAEAANKMIEFVPEKKAPAMESTVVSVEVAQKQQLEELKEAGLKVPRSSKYYKSPLKKPQPAQAHKATSILKPSTEALGYSAVPLVVFTPSSVPPELAHLFPNKTMAIPTQAAMQMQLQALLSAPSVANNHSNDTIAVDPVSHNIIQKYGPIPSNFGGCISDFFFMGVGTEKSTDYSRQNQHASTGIIFLDLLTLQRSYVPTAFDSTDEWNDIKDFLWLLGSPFKPLKKVEETLDNDKQPGGGPSTAASVCSEISGERDAYTYAHDPRYFFYKIAINMNNIQACFTDTETQKVQTNNNPQINREADPIIPNKSNNPSHVGLKAVKLPEIATPPGGKKPSAPTATFMASPVAQIKRALSLEAQALRDQADADEDKFKALEADLDWLHIPSNISRKDVHRLVRFSKLCEEYVLLVLELFQPKEYGWPNEMFDPTTGRCLTQSVRYNVQYLRYYGLATTEVENHLMNLVDLSYTAVFIEKHLEHKSEDLNNGHQARKVSFIEQQIVEEQQHNGDNEGWREKLATTAAGSGRKVPNLLHNPPRYWRLAVDCMYEVSAFIKEKAEGGYPLDSVRSHLWAHAGRALIARQRAIAAQCATEIGAHTAFISPRSAILSRLDEVIPQYQTASHHSLITTTAADTIKSIDNNNSKTAASHAIALQLWLKELLLNDYEAYFQHQGFRRLEDFVGLTEDDCTQYFPFLKAGDLRRLTRAAPLLTDETVRMYYDDEVL